MTRSTVLLVGALCVLCAALGEGATPTPTIRSRGAKRAFGGPRTTRSRPSPQPAFFSTSPTPTPVPTPSPSSFASSSSPSTASPAPLDSSRSEEVARSLNSPRSAVPHQSRQQSFTPKLQTFTPKPLSFAPQPQGFSPQPKSFSPQPQGFSPQPQGFSPQPQGFSPQPQSFSSQPQSFSSQPQSFSPQPQSFSPQPQSFPRQRQVVPSAPTPFASARPSAESLSSHQKRTKHVPIVAMKFNLREDGSYTTSSETGDGTVRQERGDFNGEGMAVQGMYAYRDHDQGAVQVNYVADEYGFQPQGPNIHPAIMQAVAEQVMLARSAKSRAGAAGLNGLQDQEEDYDDTPSPKAKTAVRRIVVRRL